MNIIVRNFNVWGNASTKGIKLGEDATVDDLMMHV